jgi:hypothetical protein
MQDILELCKLKAANVTLLTCLNTKQILLAVNLWEDLFTKWEKPKEKMPHKGSGWRRRYTWYWSGAVFQSTTAAIELGSNYIQILRILKDAYVIYPDGTVNEEFMETLSPELLAEAQTKK